VLLTEGAVVPPEGSVDAGVAWHYGDPLGEQRRLSGGEGLVDLSHRPIVAISGEDRLTWLHTLTSQHLEHLGPDVFTQALVLSANGHVEHHLTLVDDGATTLAHVEPGTAEALVAYLDSMKFWSKVEVSVRADLAVIWRPGPTGMDADARFDFVEKAGLADIDGPPAGTWAFEALRVAAGIPRLGKETDHRTIPAEVGWIGPAVHLEKGCYRGQETVARVHNLGKPPRRLVRLHLDGSADELPESGEDVLLGERRVGFIGTTAQHYELGPIALGLVKRNTPDDAELRTAPGSSVQIEPSATWA
jgi:folate-binding protein YgfZ